MRFDAITLFPDFFQSIAGVGVVGRAIDKGLVDLSVWNPRDHAVDKHNTVDDRPYGGGPGMLMKPEPLAASICDAKKDDDRPAHVIYLSPQGRKLDDKLVDELILHKRIILVCGRYEGVDERLIEAEVDEEISVGDYVLSGGELAAAIIIDAVSRKVPGVLGHKNSAKQDSYVDGLLDYPHYTRPEIWEGMKVPEVLLSGNHGLIAEWRDQQSKLRTQKRRPDLYRSYVSKSGKKK